MAKLTQAGLQKFTDNIPGNISVFLAYGNDDGLIFESSQNVAKKINPDLNDPFNVEYLTTAQIKEDAGVLYMAATSTSLMGGRKLIIIKDAADGATDAVKDFLKLQTDAFLVLFGVGLNRKSTLVQAVENSDKAMGLGCYADDVAALRQLIAQMLYDAKIKTDEETTNFLISKLGADRKMTRSEIDKLITYMGDEQTLTIEDAKKCIDDAATVSFEGLTDAIFAKNPKATCQALKKLYGEGETEIAILRIVASFIKKFIPVYRAVEQGQSVPVAMGYIRPKPNFKQEAKIKAGFRNWNYNALNKAMEILFDTEINCKTTNYPAAIICERALLQIINIKQ